MASESEHLELATRESAGLHVQLLWDRSADAVTVAVEDLRAGDRFRFAVARERALDAFYHPFAYANPPERSVRWQRSSKLQQSS